MLVAMVLASAAAQAAPPDRAARLAEMQQLPGVYKVAAQGGLCSNVFLVLTPQPVLIDAGSRPCWDQLVENLALLGVKVSDLRWVLGTHGHWDHVDNMARLQRENPKIRFAIHAGDAQFVINNDRVFSCAEPLYKGVASDPIRVDRMLLDGDRIVAGRMSFRVVHTPGHTPGSVVYVTQIAGKKVGFCGDSVTGYYSMTNRSSVIDWEQSMKRLLAEDFDLLFTGHDKRPVEGKEKIAAYLNKSLAAAVAKRKQFARDEQYQDLVYEMEHGQ
jgi:glyoxylase-like metal-dependent hydrolase (beta-lactamase superfamily II)